MQTERQGLVDRQTGRSEQYRYVIPDLSNLRSQTSQEPRCHEGPRVCGRWLKGIYGRSAARLHLGR